MPSAPSMWLQMRSRLGPTVAQIMVGLFAIHLTFLITVHWLHSNLAATVYEDWLALSWSALFSGRVWTLATYALLHDLRDFTHILFNLLALFFFGPALERQWGPRAFLRFLGLSVVLGGVLQALSELVVGQADITVGASAGMMGLLAAFAWSNPDAKILLFFVLPVPARHLVPIVLGIDLISYLSGSHIAFFAHLGGVLGAWISVRGLTNPRIARAWLRGVTTWVNRRLGRRSHVTLVDRNRNPSDRSKWN